MKVLHVQQQARFIGGVERILHDIATGLSAQGHPQGLLFQGAGSDPEFLTPFEWSGMERREALERFDPDVIRSLHPLQMTTAMTSSGAVVVRENRVQTAAARQQQVTACSPHRKSHPNARPKIYQKA